MQQKNLGITLQEYFKTHKFQGQAKEDSIILNPNIPFQINQTDQDYYQQHQNKEIFTPNILHPKKKNLQNKPSKSISNQIHYQNIAIRSSQNNKLNNSFIKSMYGTIKRQGRFSFYYKKPNLILSKKRMSGQCTLQTKKPTHKFLQLNYIQQLLNQKNSDLKKKQQILVKQTMSITKYGVNIQRNNKKRHQKIQGKFFK